MAHTDPTTPLPEPPERELFSDPAAAVVWAGLMVLDVALQHEFLACLRDRLAVPGLVGGTHAVRIQRLVAAVREAEGLLVAAAGADPGFDPTNPPALTEDAYTDIRKDHPEYGWPPASSMRNWVQGGWNDVLRRAGVKPVEGGDALFVSSSAEYTWEEVAAAFVAFRDELVQKGHPAPTDFSLRDLLNWAKRPDVLARPGRRPRSQSPFDKFGGFLAAKAAALAGAPAPSETRDGARAARSGHLRPASGYGYTDAQLKTAVDEVVAFLGRVPRATEFTNGRRDILKAEAKRGLAKRPFPSYPKLIDRWTPWDAALVACGYPPFGDIDIDPETGAGSYQGPRREISSGALLAGVVEAYEKLGKPFTEPAYENYYKQRPKVSADGRRIASYGCMYGRFRDVAGSRGVFKYVCDLALPEGWDVLDD